MEEILNKLSNPFEMDKFKRLMDLYLESKDKQEFYAKIVTYYQDRDMQGEPKSVNLNSNFITYDFMDPWKHCEYFSNFFPTEHRIYINSSLSSTGSIVQLFIDECIKQNLPFELKYALENHRRSDGIVIGSNTKVYKKHIDILRKIAKEYPELVKQCGTPHLLTANLDNWMGLADENVGNRYRSYTQSRIDMFDVAIKKFLLNHRELGSQVEGFDKLVERYEYSNARILDGIKGGRISQEDYKQELDKKVSKELSTFTVSLEKNALKTFIQNDASVFLEIYEIFLKECEIQGINSNMPTLYEGSKEDLISFDNSRKNEKSIYTDGKSPISLINEYFSKSEHNLSVEDELQLLKVIDEKFKVNSELMKFMFAELEKLATQGLINKNLVDSNLMTSKISHVLANFLERGLIQKMTYKDHPDVRSMIVTEGEDLTDEKAKDIINMRINQLYSYFNKPLESIEEKKKCIDTLQMMLEKYEAINPYLNYNNVTKKFLGKIEYLEFEIQNDDKLRQGYSVIASLLKNRTCTDEEIKHIVEDFKPKKILANPDYEFWGEEPEYKLEDIPEVASESVVELEKDLSDYIEQGKEHTEISFSGQDIGEASYDANTSLCIESSNVVKNLQRSNIKNDPSK